MSSANKKTNIIIFFSFYYTLLFNLTFFFSCSLTFLLCILPFRFVWSCCESDVCLHMMRVEGCIVPDACSCDLNVCLSRAPSVGWSWIHTNERPRKKLKWLPIRHFERMNVFRLFLFFFFNSNLDHHCYTTWLYCLNQFNQANWEILSTPCVILGVIWDSVFDLACFHHPRLHHQFKNTKKKK